MLALWTGRTEGDLRALGTGGVPAVAPPGVAAGRTVYRCTQVHGAEVVVVGDPPDGSGLARWAPGPAGAPPSGDALVSAGADDILAVLSADCATLALASPEGVHAAVHVGWRGLLAGVVASAVSAARALGAGRLLAAVGPAIGPCCYEFGAADLDAVSARFGDEVRGVTAAGRPALDLRAGVRVAAAEAGVAEVAVVGGCTACTEDTFSFRRAGDEARQALLVWRAPGP